MVEHLCGLPEFGTYEGQVILVAPEFLCKKWPNGIGIDVCLALEIQSLWRAGIETNGHCCGHGRAPAYISVWPDSAEAMRALGYETYPHPDSSRNDHFFPKTEFASLQERIRELEAEILKLIEMIGRRDKRIQDLEDDAALKGAKP